MCKLLRIDVNCAHIFRGILGTFVGVVCKSEYEDLGDEYDDLLDDCKELAHEHDDIIDKYNKLLNRYKNRESEYEEFELCVRYATTLEEVKSCFNAG